MWRPEKQQTDLTFPFCSRSNFSCQCIFTKAQTHYNCRFKPFCLSQRQVGQNDHTIFLHYGRRDHTNAGRQLFPQVLLHVCYPQYMHCNSFQSIPWRSHQVWICYKGVPYPWENRSLQAKHLKTCTTPTRDPLSFLNVKWIVSTNFKETWPNCGRQNSPSKNLSYEKPRVNLTAVKEWNKLHSL